MVAIRTREVTQPHQTDHTEAVLPDHTAVPHLVAVVVVMVEADTAAVVFMEVVEDEAEDINLKLNKNRGESFFGSPFFVSGISFHIVKLLNAAFNYFLK